MRINVRRARLSLLIGASLVLAACGGDDGSDGASTNLGSAPSGGTIAPPASDAFVQIPSSDTRDSSTQVAELPPTETPVEHRPAPVEPTPTPVEPAPFEPAPIVHNTVPAISGTPPSTVLEDTAYVFVPEAFDGDGDILHFKVSNLPAWAHFEPRTGRIHGTPSPADVGTYADIKITVTDGADDAELGPFSITVSQVATGWAQLSWAAPIENDDGTALTDLAGYRIYWGTQPHDLTNSVTIANPAVHTYVIDNLVPGTYYFVATAFNVDGTESDPSGVTSVTIT